MEQPDPRSLCTEIRSNGRFPEPVTPPAALPEAAPRALGAPCPSHPVAGTLEALVPCFGGKQEEMHSLTSAARSGTTLVQICPGLVWSNLRKSAGERGQAGSLREGGA